ncbi:hypothetical protein [Brachybacterium sp. FME24]|uniref:hypothetical protein n=1 Tax=Brachybacterium sp. FME24 TaxID=2742605 RepID=UPI0018682626|nr:hypothetical protein [Brachybacterium sp. FME24]
MIDIDIARRLQHAGLPWEPGDGDFFTIDTDLLREDAFMLSTMVVEPGFGAAGERVFRFNGTTEWALDSVEQHQAIWIPREEQLRAALGDAFRSLRQEVDGAYVVTVGRPREDELRETRAPRAEDAYAGALLIHLTS